MTFEHWMLLWTMIGTVFTGAATIGLIVTAVVTLRGAGAQLGLLREQGEREVRPYVTASLALGLNGMWSFDLIIENHGKTTAKEVRVEFLDAANFHGNLWDQYPKMAAAGDQYRAELEKFAGRTEPYGIDLVPGERIRLVWVFPNADQTEFVGATSTVIVGLTYFGDDGHTYTDRRLIEWNPNGMTGATRVMTSGGNDEEPTKTLKSILLALQILNEHVGELRR